MGKGSTVRVPSLGKDATFDYPDVAKILGARYFSHPKAEILLVDRCGGSLGFIEPRKSGVEATSLEDSEHSHSRGVVSAATGRLYVYLFEVWKDGRTWSCLDTYSLEDGKKAGRKWMPCRDLRAMLVDTQGQCLYLKYVDGDCEVVAIRDQNDTANKPSRSQ